MRKLLIVDVGTTEQKTYELTPITYEEFVFFRKPGAYVEEFNKFLRANKFRELSHFDPFTLRESCMCMSEGEARISFTAPDNDALREACLRLENASKAHRGKSASIETLNEKIAAEEEVNKLWCVDK